jgi:hypothetical protein
MDNYKVNRPGQVEALYQPLYDFQTYDSAGVTSQTFFQSPIGQSGKTRSDTNMELAGQIPAGQEFLVTDIQVVFFPGNEPATSSTTIPPVATNWQDVWNVLKAGNLDFFIGSKSYFRDAPLMKFPPDFRLAGIGHSYFRMGTDADQSVVFDYATHAGPVRRITPIKLMANQNFAVTLNFDSAISVDSDARVGIILGGFLYRLSQ